MAGNNGTASLHRPNPDVALIGGQYGAPTAQAFAPSPNQQYGKQDPIPPTNNGITAQRTWTKINHALTPGPLAKIVVRLQQSRF